jgi:hypothetical protein
MRRKLLALVVVVSCVLPGCARDFEWDRYVGQSRGQVIAELGEPTREEPWYTGMGHARPPYRKTRTLIYEKPDGGREYVALEEVDGTWTCYRSAYVPKGWSIE